MNTQAWCGPAILLAAMVVGLGDVAAAQEPGAAPNRRSLEPIARLQEEFRQLQFGMFLHYNMATYHGVQWVSGYPDPATFDPGGKVDTDAWADAAVSAGMTYAVLTVKHVAGFCLWDSELTTYDVMHPDCPYQQDLVAQFLASCKSRGLKAGLYYCWRHPGFDDKYKVLPPECDPATHTPAQQIAFQQAQIAELLTRYPDVFYLWNDALDDQVLGAEPALAPIRALRPDVLTSSNWWSWAKKGTPYLDIAVEEMRQFPADNKAPGETCWCLEQQWFWNDGARAKPASRVLELMATANGRNSNFLLNVGPDRSGRIVASSVRTLAEVGRMRVLAQDQEIPWPEFMRRHAMTFDALPQSWTEAPHFGNAMVGPMLYQAGDTIRLQVFRADVHDHRDETYGWTAYSRPRLRIGHFALHPVGELTGCHWRKDLWNAELTGVIETSRGQIEIRHLTHADDMAIVTELSPSPGERDCRWTWHPAPAATTRGGYPTTAAGIAGFARRYGEHYAETLQPYAANPPGRAETIDGVSVWVQDLLAGGQYATAWSEQIRGETRTHVVSIANSHPAATAAATAAADVKHFSELDRSRWIDIHRRWWHDYYRRSWVALPDDDLESLYWQTIYRLGCTARAGRCTVDTPGLWFQGKSWPYFTTDWNIQSALWPVYAANRLEQGQALVDRLHDRRAELIAAVRPVAWQEDSAYLPLAVAWDLRGSREGDMRYYDLVGNLPWAMHNAWLQYRYAMDDRMLREKVYPLLRRSINFYLHMVREEEDGRLHLPPTFSPETGVFADCNFDLALFRWGCHTLLKASRRLAIDDPLIPRWQEVVERLPDYPVDAHGFRLGRDRSSSSNHQHFSNLLMIYPLHLAHIEQEGTANRLRRSFDRARSTAGPGERQAMVQAHAGPIGAALGLGDETLRSLRQLQGDLHPNGLWYDPPCIEATLAVANIVQDMLIQSWSDPAADEPGPIRIFPAVPSSWPDVEFRNLRAEGAFLVSAKRTAGRTEWVRIESLAGEPCRVRPGLTGDVRGRGDRAHALREVAPGIYELDLKKGEKVVLY